MSNNIYYLFTRIFASIKTGLSTVLSHVVFPILAWLPKVGAITEVHELRAFGKLVNAL